MKYAYPFNYMISGYYGISEIDDYDLKEFILNDVKEYIEKYINEHYDNSISYRLVAEVIDKEYTILEKLNDALLVLKDIDGPMELIIMVKRKIREIK